jgi:hypothetical protein
MEYLELSFHNFLFKPSSANLHCVFIVSAGKSSAIVPPSPFLNRLSEKDFLPIVSRFHR